MNIHAAQEDRGEVALPVLEQTYVSTNDVNSVVANGEGKSGLHGSTTRVTSKACPRN